MDSPQDQGKSTTAEKEEIYIRLFDIITMENLRLANEIERLKIIPPADKKALIFANLRGLRKASYAFAFYGFKGFVKVALRKLHLYKG